MFLGRKFRIGGYSVRIPPLNREVFRGNWCPTYMGQPYMPPFTNPNTYILRIPQVMGWKMNTKRTVRDVNSKIYIIKPFLSLFLPQVRDPLLKLERLDKSPKGQCVSACRGNIMGEAEGPYAFLSMQDREVRQKTHGGRAREQEAR